MSAALQSQVNAALQEIVHEEAMRRAGLADISMPLSDARAALAARGLQVELAVLRAHVEVLDAVTMANRNHEEGVPAIAFDRDMDGIFEVSG